MISIDKDIRDCFLSGLLEQLFLDGRPVIHLVQVEQTVGQPLIFEVGFHSGPERAVRFGEDLKNEKEVSNIDITVSQNKTKSRLSNPSNSVRYFQFNIKEEKITHHDGIFFDVIVDEL